jgi:hypothetical protein
LLESGGDLGFGVGLGGVEMLLYGGHGGDGLAGGGRWRGRLVALASDEAGGGGQSEKSDG